MNHARRCKWTETFQCEEKYEKMHENNLGEKQDNLSCEGKNETGTNTCRFLSDAFEEADAVNLSTKSFSCAVELHKNKLSRFTSQKRELKTILIKSFFPSFHFRSLEDPEY